VAGDIAPGVGGADPRQLSQLSEEEVPDQLSPQVPVLLDVLAAIGLAQAGAPEAEADDASSATLTSSLPPPCPRS
jgi:5'-3' exonuclease